MLDELLIKACIEGNTEKVLDALSKGANVNAKVSGYTGLHAASANGHSAIVQLLIDQGADIEAKEDKWQETALHFATQTETISTNFSGFIKPSLKKQFDVFHVLLKNGANLEANNQFGETPFVGAAVNGCIEMVILMLDMGAKYYPHAKVSVKTQGVIQSKIDAFQQKTIFSGLDKGAYCIANLRGGQFATGSHDTFIRIYSPEGACLKVLTGHADYISDLALLQNGFLASASADSTIRIWNPHSGECIKVLSDHSGFILKMLVLPNGYLVSCGGGCSGQKPADTVIRIWDTQNGECVTKLSPSGSNITALAYLNENQLLSGNTHGDIQLWDLTSRACLKTMRVSGHVYGLTVLSERLILAMCPHDSDNCLFTLNIEKGEVVKKFLKHPQGIYRSFRVNEYIVVFCTQQSVITIMDLRTGIKVNFDSKHNLPQLQGALLLPDQTLVTYGGQAIYLHTDYPGKRLIDESFLALAERESSVQAVASEKIMENVRPTVSNTILRGLSFQKVPGDGHCLFHAVGIYLGQDHQQIRDQVADYLQNNPEEFQEQMLVFAPSRKEYIRQIRETNTYGDAIEIEIIQRITRRPIIIIRPDANPIIPDNVLSYTESPIFIYYDGHIHYDAFTIEDGYDAREILRSIQEALSQGGAVRFSPMTQFDEHSQIMREVKETSRSGQAAPSLDSLEKYDRLKEERNLLSATLHVWEAHGLSPAEKAFDELLIQLGLLFKRTGISSRRCFISYAWGKEGEDRDQLQKWLIRLKKDLTKLNVDVFLDLSNMHGDMKQVMLENIQNRDYFLLIGTPDLKDNIRFDVHGKPITNVAFEYSHIMEKTKGDRGKLIPLLYSGDFTTAFPDEVTPVFIRKVSSKDDYWCSMTKIEDPLGIIPVIFQLHSLYRECEKEYRVLLKAFEDRCMRVKLETQLKLAAPRPVVWNIPSAHLEVGEHRLGGGAFGDVYKGKLKGTIVAVKQIRNNPTVDSQEEFEREVQIMMGLSHPHIVQFYGVCIDASYKIIMEFMVNGSLYDVLHNHVLYPDSTFNLKKRLQIALDVSNGIHYLHGKERNIVHGDIKSLNILLNDHLQAKISDFGLSRIRQTQQSQVSHDPQGTLAYKAPERYEGTMSKASDIYSFAIVLWEVLTRQEPYQGLEGCAIMFKVFMKDERPDIPAHSSVSISALIRHCWLKSPAERPVINEVVEKLNLEVQCLG